MPEPIGDFWPEDIGLTNIRTPGVILKEVASQLGPKTQQVVRGDVITSSMSDQIAQYFYLLVPAMDNYKYQLFYIVHPVTLYPLTLVWNNVGSSVVSEEAFIAKVKEIIGSDETKKIVQALLAQGGGPT